MVKISFQNRDTERLWKRFRENNFWDWTMQLLEKCEIEWSWLNDLERKYREQFIRCRWFNWRRDFYLMFGKWVIFFLKDMFRLFFPQNISLMSTLKMKVKEFLGWKWNTKCSASSKLGDLWGARSLSRLFSYKQSHFFVFQKSVRDSANSQFSHISSLVAVLDWQIFAVTSS